MTISDWNKARARCKKRFEAAGITYCQECGRHDYLSFAHRVKRRFITDEAELEVVALLCMSNPDAIGCHNRLEIGDKQVMYDTVTKFHLEASL